MKEETTVANRVQRVAAHVLVIVGWMSAILALSWISGCGTSEPGQGDDRYARRYLPHQKEWRLESQIPPIPQETPGMVIWEVSDYSPETAASPEQTAGGLDG